MIVSGFKGRIVLAKLSESGRKTELFRRDSRIAEQDGDLYYRLEVDGITKGYAKSYMDAKVLYQMFA